jgi:hypothetical protein
MPITRSAASSRSRPGAINRRPPKPFVLVYRKVSKYQHGGTVHRWDCHYVERTHQGKPLKRIAMTAAELRKLESIDKPDDGPPAVMLSACRKCAPVWR